MLMHCSCDNVWIMSHSFEPVGFDKLTFTGFTKKTLLYPNFSFACAISNNIFGFTIDTVLGHIIHLKRRERCPYIYIIRLVYSTIYPFGFSFFLDMGKQSHFKLKCKYVYVSYFLFNGFFYS